MSTRFRISETDYCPKCGAWNPDPAPVYEQGLTRDRIRVYCACGYTVTHHCLDDPMDRMDALIARVREGAK